MTMASASKPEDHRATSVEASEVTERGFDSLWLEVTQTRSAIGSKPKHRSTLRALGLRSTGASHVLPDRPEIHGMLAKVAHLVRVRPADAPAGGTGGKGQRR